MKSKRLKSFYENIQFRLMISNNILTVREFFLSYLIRKMQTSILIVLSREKNFPKHILLLLWKQ